MPFNLCNMFLDRPGLDGYTLTADNGTLMFIKSHYRCSMDEVNHIFHGAGS